MREDELLTWEGSLEGAELDGLIAAAAGPDTVFFGQRAGDIVLVRNFTGSAASWAHGRCFNANLEIRFWSEESEDRHGVLILGQLPTGWSPTAGLSHQPRRGTGTARPYLCIGRYDPEQETWWEPRFGQPLRYLEDGPKPERIFLQALVYDLDDGSRQHRLVGFSDGGQRKEGGPA